MIKNFLQLTEAGILDSKDVFEKLYFLAAAVLNNGGYSNRFTSCQLL